MSGSGKQAERVAQYSPAEIEILKQAGQIVAGTLQLLYTHLQPGITTAELDNIAEEYLRAQGAVPSCKGYKGYPATICTEIEDVVVHGIPDHAKLQEGQIVGIDLVGSYQGYHGDSTITVAIGEVDEERQRLMQVTEDALRAGIRQARAGNRLRQVCQAIQEHVEKAGFSVVRDLVGHGIGRQMHEPPQIPNFVVEGQFTDYELILQPGMVLAIEPMVNAGTAQVRMGQDDWTMRTADGRPSAHFEHTIAVSDGGPLILTKRGDA